MGLFTDAARGAQAGFDRNQQRVAATEASISQGLTQGQKINNIADERQQVIHIANRARRDKRYGGFFKKAERDFPAWQTDASQRRMLSSRILESESIENGWSKLIDARITSPEAAESFRGQPNADQLRQIKLLLGNADATKRQGLADGNIPTTEETLSNEQISLGTKAQVINLTSKLLKGKKSVTAKDVEKAREETAKIIAVTAALVKDGIIEEGDDISNPDTMAKLLLSDTAGKIFKREKLDTGKFSRLAGDALGAAALSRKEQIQTAAVADEVINRNFSGSIKNDSVKSSSLSVAKTERDTFYTVNIKTGVALVNNPTNKGSARLTRMDLGNVNGLGGLDVTKNGMPINIGLGNFSLPVKINPDGTVANLKETSQKLKNIYVSLIHNPDTKEALTVVNVADAFEETVDAIENEGVAIIRNSAVKRSGDFVSDLTGFPTGGADREKDFAGQDLIDERDDILKALRAGKQKYSAPFPNVWGVFDNSQARAQNMSVKDFVVRGATQQTLLMARYNALVQKVIEFNRSQNGK